MRHWRTYLAAVLLLVAARLAWGDSTFSGAWLSGGSINEVQPTWTPTATPTSTPTSTPTGTPTVTPTPTATFLWILAGTPRVRAQVATISVAQPVATISVAQPVATISVIPLP